MSYKDDLVEELRDEVSELSKIEVGSDKYKVSVDGISKLAEAINSIEKLDTETELKRQQMRVDVDIKKQEIQNEKKNNRMRNAIAIGTFIGSIAVYGLTYISSMRYEVNGVFPTTEGGKNALRQLFRIKE